MIWKCWAPELLLVGADGNSGRGGVPGRGSLTGRYGFSGRGGILGKGGTLGRGGVSSGVSCLRRSGWGAPVPFTLNCVGGFCAVQCWQGRHLAIWFWWSIAGCLSIAAFNLLSPGHSTPRFFSIWTAGRGFWIRDSFASIAAILSNGYAFPGQFLIWFNPTPDRGNRSYHTNNPDHWKWAHFITKSRHFKFTILAPIEHLSSDGTMTWSVRPVCSIGRCFAFRCQNCDQTNIRLVAIEIPRISVIIWCYITAIQRILVRGQIWKRDQKSG